MTQKNIKGIIFDMDGTILDTIDDITDSINHSLMHFGYETHSVDHVKKALGNGGRNLVKSLVPKTLSDQEITRVFEVYQTYYNTHNNIKTKPYEGILTLLKTLKDLGYKLAVVSNKFQHLVTDLNEEMFESFFDIAIGERKGIPIKPAPDMIYLALTELNLNPEDVIFIGDSEVDILTAKNAKIDAIGVTWGFRDRQTLIEAGATVLIDVPMELKTYLKREST